MSLAALLAEVAKEIGAVKKGDKNTHQNYQFRGVDAVTNAVAGPLHEKGIVVLPTLNAIHTESVQTSTGKPAFQVIVDVTYTFHGPDLVAADGSVIPQSLSCRVPGEAMDSGDKATPKAMSVAFRTALLQALTLPTDEPDPDTQVYERAPAEAKRNYVTEAKFAALALMPNDKEAAASLYAVVKDEYGVPTADTYDKFVELLEDHHKALTAPYEHAQY